MKTTIEIADPLLDDARRLARERGTTLRALVEEGLRRVVRDGRQPQEDFRMVTFGDPDDGFDREAWERALREAREGR